MTIIEKEVIIRGIKLIDFGFITTIYFFLGFLSSRIVDRSQTDTNELEKRRTVWLFLEIIIILWYNSIIMYIIKNLVESIPFPLDTIYGFNHNRTLESDYAGISVFSFALFYFQKKLPKKMNVLYDRIFDKPLIKFDHIV